MKSEGRVQEHSGPGPTGVVRIGLRLSAAERQHLAARGNSVADAVRGAVAAAARRGNISCISRAVGEREVVKVLIEPSLLAWVDSQAQRLAATRSDVVVAAARQLAATGPAKPARRHGPIVSRDQVGDLQVLAGLNILRTLRDEVLSAFPPTAACELVARLSAVERAFRELRKNGRGP